MYALSYRGYSGFCICCDCVVRLMREGLKVDIVFYEKRVLKLLTSYGTQNGRVWFAGRPLCRADGVTISVSGRYRKNNGLVVDLFID